MELPMYISVVFIATTCLTVFAFYKAANNSKATLLVIVLWLTLQSFISLTGFYTKTDTLPPRFILLVGPPLLLIAFLFMTTRGRLYLDRLDVKYMTLLHTVRIPVELVLFWLFAHKAVPELMTFEGQNFDILSGITAPILYYLGFVKNMISKSIILAWNFICLGLLFNIVITAILSAPTPFQKFGFEQPNIGVLYFPFTWLPAAVVPLVLLSHLASIRKLLLPTQNFRPQLH
jgi:hypothetical protein